MELLFLSDQIWNTLAAWGRGTEDQLTLALGYDRDGVPIMVTVLGFPLFNATMDVLFHWDGETYAGACQVTYISGYCCLLKCSYMILIMKTGILITRHITQLKDHTYHEGLEQMIQYSCCNIC